LRSAMRPAAVVNETSDIILDRNEYPVRTLGCLLLGYDSKAVLVPLLPL